MVVIILLSLNLSPAFATESPRYHYEFIEYVKALRWQAGAQKRKGKNKPLLKVHKRSRETLKKLAFLIRFPVTLRETAYEIKNGCARHYRDAKINNVDQLLPTLKKLQAAWKSGKIQTWDVLEHGTATQADCEHIYSIRMNPAGRRIVRITVDADDNVWSPARKEFNKSD